MTTDDFAPTIARTIASPPDLAPTIVRPPYLKTQLPRVWKSCERDENGVLQDGDLLPAFDFETSDGIPCSAPPGFRPLPGMGLIWSTSLRDGRPATVLDVSDNGRVVWIGDDDTRVDTAEEGKEQWLMCNRWHLFPDKVKLAKDGWYRRETHTRAPPVIWGCRLTLYDLNKTFPGRGIHRPAPLLAALHMPSCCVVVDGVVRQVGGWVAEVDNPPRSGTPQRGIDIWGRT